MSNSRTRRLAEFIVGHLSAGADADVLGDRVVSYLYERDLISSEHEAIRVETFVSRIASGKAVTAAGIAEQVVAEFGLDEGNR